MSPRFKTRRKVLELPIIKGFKPFGILKNTKSSNPVILLIEEYEALRLCDYEQLNHHAASVEMGVSRPTLTRIYASALRKIAQAFVEGRSISIEGGKVYFDSEWFHCSTCTCHFNHSEKNNAPDVCPLCSSSDIQHILNDKEVIDEVCNSNVEYCICAECGEKIIKKRGFPCRKMICPNCKLSLIRDEKE